MTVSPSEDDESRVGEQSRQSACFCAVCVCVFAQNTEHLLPSGYIPEPGLWCLGWLRALQPKKRGGKAMRGEE